MKLNWGKSIVIVLACFVAFIVTLTSKMMMKSTELESEDYYQREVNYESEIQAQRNAQAQDAVSFKDENEHLVILVHAEKQVDEITVQMTRPNSKKLDKTYHFKDSKTYLIPKTELQKGIYRIELSYEIDGKPCLIKEDIIL